MEKLDLYKTVHKINPHYGRGGVELFPVIAEFVQFLSPKSILDYGCGKGNLVRTLTQNYPAINVYGYDPAIEEFDKLPKDKVDFVINTDVLEHIPEYELPETIAKISSLSKNVFFHLHHGKASFTLPNGENAHCTVWPPEKYYALLSEFFPYVSILPGLNPVNSVCATFALPQEFRARYYRLIARSYNLRLLNRITAKVNNMLSEKFNLFFREFI